MKKDFIITFCTEFLILAGGLLVYKFAATILGNQGFSEYTLSRRTISFIYPLLLISTSVGIPRYISFANASAENQKKSDNYFIAGVSMILVFSILCLIILNLFKDSFAFILFSSKNYSYLIFPISIMLLGLVIHALTYSYFRGNLQMFKANALKIINMGLFPVAVFVLGKTTEKIILLTGLMVTINSIFFLFLIIKNIRWNFSKDLLPYGKELFYYGIQRLPGDFCMAALLALPATITAHFAGVKEAGHVAFATSLLTMTGAAFVPIGLILLPKASQIIAKKDFALLKKYVVKLLKITIGSTLTGIIIFEIFTEEIISIYLGESFYELNFITRIIMIAATPYAIFVTMRSIIDAYHVKSVNVINVVISLIVFVSLIGLIILLNYSEHSIAFISCFVIAIFTLAMLTLVSIFNIIRKTNKVTIENKI